MTDDHDLAAALTLVLDHLLDLVLEAKQAVWTTPTGPGHDALEDLRGFLTDEVALVALAGDDLGQGHLRVLGIAGRQVPNMLAETGADIARVTTRLAGDLRPVAAEARADADRYAGAPAGPVLARLAAGLDDQIARLTALAAPPT